MNHEVNTPRGYDDHAANNQRRSLAYLERMKKSQDERKQMIQDLCRAIDAEDAFDDLPYVAENIREIQRRLCHLTSLVDEVIEWCADFCDIPMDSCEGCMYEDTCERHYYE